MVSGCTQPGYQISLRAGKRKSGGITPTIVNVRAEKLTVAPSASGRPPKRRSQKSWLMTAVNGLPTTSSGGSSARPSFGADAEHAKEAPG